MEVPWFWIFHFQTWLLVAFFFFFFLPLVVVAVAVVAAVTFVSSGWSSDAVASEKPNRNF